MSLNLEAHTACQFVADFFSNQAKGINYSDFDCCWNEYVGWVAEAGALLEQVIQSIPGKPECDDWYDLLEEATAEFRRLLLESHGNPDSDQLANAFRTIVDRHAVVEYEGRAAR